MLTSLLTPVDVAVLLLIMSFCAAVCEAFANVQRLIKSSIDSADNPPHILKDTTVTVNATVCNYLMLHFLHLSRFVVFIYTLHFFTGVQVYEN